MTIRRHVVWPSKSVREVPREQSFDPTHIECIAGAINLDMARYLRLALAVEGGMNAYRWEEPEYLTEDNMETEHESRTVPTRVMLQLSVSI